MTMEEQTNNVGGSNMGMAPLVPGTPAGGQMQAGMLPAQRAPQPTGFNAQQPQAADSQAGQNGASHAAVSTDKAHNDVSNTSSPTSAEDSDLIEKEWVEKAKAIVEKTRRDPFLQSQELNQFKTEYLQKRYGKNVGSSEY
jgi:hypothetical protein